MNSSKLLKVTATLAAKNVKVMALGEEYFHLFAFRSLDCILLNFDIEFCCHGLKAISVGFKKKEFVMTIFRHPARCPHDQR